MRHSKAGRSIALSLLLIAFLCSAFALIGCGGHEGETAVRVPAPTDTLRVDSIVEGMYRLFIDGRYEDYVRIQAGCDEKPKEYVDQTVVLLKMLHQRMDSLHRGPKDCRLVRYQRHGEDYIDAFLEVQFKDTTTEVILIPLLLQHGEWRIR